MVLVLVGLWAGWRAWTIAHELDDAAAKAQVMKAALERGDVPGARRALEEFQSAARAAAHHSDGPTWSLVRDLPFVGDDASGVRTVSDVLDEIGTDGLPPIMSAAGKVTGDAFQPRDHRFPLAQIAAMQQPAEESSAAFERASSQLAQVDSSGFVGPFRTRFDELRRLVDAAHATLGSTYRAARMMPDLLGADGPRNYILVMENNAELRSGGGLPGSLSLIHAAHGRVHIVSQDDSAHQATGAQPVLPITREERALFGPVLAISPVDATMTPDLPRSAQLIKARWEHFHRQEIDGVIFVDPVAVSYLMQGLGEVAVPGYPVGVNWTNVVADVENVIYRVTSDNAAQSAYQNAVAKAVFNVFADGHGDPVTAIRGLVRGVEEGRIKMHSFVPADQQQIAGTKIAGEFPTTPTAHPQAGVYVNDSTESKMSYYLQYGVNLTASSCGDGIQEADGSMTLTNATPPDLAKLPVSVTGWGDRTRHITKGQQFVVVYLTSPIGGSITSLTIDGKPVARPALVPFARREVAGVGVRLAPRSTHTIAWTLRSGIRQSASWQLAVTPGAQPGTQSAVVPSAC